MEERQYYTACENYGTCRVLMLEEQGVPMNPMIEMRPGTMTATKFYDDNVPAIIHYHNCTGCKKPITQMEADRVNRFLGMSAADIVVELDNGFLAALDEM